TMPPKVYLESPPYGDFRAMPAQGDGLALLKWVTSFPANPAQGLPTVTGVVCLSDAGNGEPLMLLDARSVTALRTGAVAVVGADGPGKAEASVGAVASCALFCDEWEQASHGGELTGAVSAGLVRREAVTELGAVLAGDAAGRPGPEAVTLFDSTGLAIQDLAVAAAALEAWRAGKVRAQTVTL